MPTHELAAKYIPTQKSKLTQTRANTRNLTRPSTKNHRLDKPLCKAARKGNINKLISLLQEGADPNTQDHHGMTPLHHAVQSRKINKLKIIELLLECGAKPDIIAQDGMSALDLALLSEQTEIQDILINHTHEYAQETRAKKSYAQKAPSQHTVDISFLIVDMKYDNGKLKVLEFGEGPRSYFQGHDKLFGKGVIWDRLWDCLEPYNLPIWYVGEKPKTTGEKKHIAHAKLKKIGGECVPNLYTLFNDKYFKKAEAKNIDNKYAITDHNGIVVFRHYKKHPNTKSAFKRNHPNFIILDSAATPHVNNKYNTSKLFDDDELKDFKPRWKIYPKGYSKRLARRIIKDIPSDVLVIKPLSAANGWGIIIVHKNDLQKTLAKIFSPKNRPQLEHIRDKSYSYWAQDNHHNFLVEECATSQPIRVHGKNYNGTMRIVLVMTYNQKEINMHVLGSYWKLPLKPIDAKGSLTERLKSKIKPGRVSSVKVSHEDLANVTGTLEKIMPKIYAKMLNIT